MMYFIISLLVFIAGGVLLRKSIDMKNQTLSETVVFPIACMAFVGGAIGVVAVVAAVCMGVLQ